MSDARPIPRSCRCDAIFVDVAICVALAEDPGGDEFGDELGPEEFDQSGDVHEQVVLGSRHHGDGVVGHPLDALLRCLGVGPRAHEQGDGIGSLQPDHASAERVVNLRRKDRDHSQPQKADDG